jgi:hypothetical protein
VNLADQAERQRKRLESLETHVQCGDVVDDLFDVLGVFGLDVVLLELKDVREDAWVPSIWLESKAS